MNIGPVDITQIIVALISFVGIVFSARRQENGKQEKRPKTTPQSKPLNPRIILWASSGLLTANLAVFGWRFSRAPDCIFDNLVHSGGSVPISEGNGQITTPRTVSGNLDFSFSNGPRAEKDYTGIAFQLPSRFDVRKCTRVDISGTSSNAFKLQIEYKIYEGDRAKIVNSSEFLPFPATTEVSTIQVPLRFNGKIDEIAVMFYVANEASQISIESVSLK